MFGLRELLVLLVVVGVVWAVTRWGERLRQNLDRRASRLEPGTVDLVACARCGTFLPADAERCGHCGHRRTRQG